MSRYQAELQSVAAVGRELGLVAQALARLLWTVASVTAHVLVAVLWFAFIGLIAFALVYRMVR